MGRRTDVFLPSGLRSSLSVVSGLLVSRHHDHERSSHKRASTYGGTTTIPAIHVQVKSSSGSTVKDVRILDIRPDEVLSRQPLSPKHPLTFPLVHVDSDSDASTSSSTESRSGRSSITLSDSETDSHLDDTESSSSDALAPPPMTELKSPVIKTRDFAYTPSPSHTPVPEIFDQHLALAEYELRMRENPRITPISGKTLHRLIELGCVTEAEANERWKKMDWNAFFIYKAAGKPYPYHTMKSMSIPRKLKEREKIVKERAMLITFYDKVRERAAHGEKAREHAEKRGKVEQAVKAVYDVDHNILARTPGISRRQTMAVIPFYAEGGEMSLDGAVRDAGRRQRLSSLPSGPPAVCA